MSKEHLRGQYCAGNEWNDRMITVGTDNIVVTSCFGACIDGNCDGVETVEVTFNVDMSLESEVNGSPYLAGGVIFGVPGENEMTLLGDNIYTFRTTLVAYSNITFTFTNGNCVDWSWYQI